MTRSSVLVKGLLTMYYLFDPFQKKGLICCVALRLSAIKYHIILLRLPLSTL